MAASCSLAVPVRFMPRFSDFLRFICSDALAVSCCAAIHFFFFPHRFVCLSAAWSVDPRVFKLPSRSLCDGASIPGLSIMCCVMGRKSLIDGYKFGFFFPLGGVFFFFYQLVRVFGNCLCLFTQRNVIISLRLGKGWRIYSVCSFFYT